jgi:hypothetical protein
MNGRSGVDKAPVKPWNEKVPFTYLSIVVEFSTHKNCKIRILQFFSEIPLSNIVKKKKSIYFGHLTKQVMSESNFALLVHVFESKMYPMC